MIMADITLLSELDFIDLLNYTWHNYVRPGQRGFSCSDTSIRYPYSPDDTVSIPVLLFVVVVPFLVMTCHGIINYLIFKRDFTSQRPHLMGMVVGALLTALLSVCIKLYTGRLAPNFYDGCQPYVDECVKKLGWKTYFLGSSCCDDNLTFQAEFNCTYPERLSEVSRSFPCMYTSLAYFSWIYLSIYQIFVSPPWIFCVYAWCPSRYTLAVIVATFLAPPTTIALTRLHDNRSHLGDVLAGCILGIFMAAVITIWTVSREISARIYQGFVSPPWIFRVFAWCPSRCTLAVIVVTFLAPPITVEWFRLRDNRSHLGDVLAGCILCIFMAAVFTIWTVSREIFARIYQIYVSPPWIFCVYAWCPSRYTLAVIVVTFLAPPTTIALTRLHYNTSHLGDVLAGCILCIFMAAVTIWTVLREISAWEYCVYVCFKRLLFASRYRPTLEVIVVTFLATPIFIAIFIALISLPYITSHLGDVLAGCILGIFMAAVFTIWTVSREISARFQKTKEMRKGKPLKPTVRVCSSALHSNVVGFVKEVDDRFLSYGDIECVEFTKLPYNDLDAFTLDGWDRNEVIILCHSTDHWTDALYDKFIPKVSTFCGKESLIVIAHDFRWKGDQAKAQQALETTPTVYEYAGNVILAGKLGVDKTYEGLWDQDWEVIRDVISNWCKMRNQITIFNPLF